MPKRLVGIVAVVLAFSMAAAGAASARTLFVSKRGRDRNACTKRNPCKTIGHAVGKARKGDTVSVAPGRYREEVKIAKDISLIGVRKPIIDATGKNNGILISGARAAGATVRGFVVQNATFEGILASRTSGVTIAKNTVQHNDQGQKASHPTGECAPAGGIPGDCGEGLHLMSVMSSTVTSNIVRNNAGGILMTDELGPTALNLISRNQALNNVLDCGITLASHNPKAVSSSGAPQPSVGGVYGNYIVNNTANGNGVSGQGGGILLAAPAPGMGTYDNIVDGNTADGNGLAGITLHSHAPDQYLNGNVITNNTASHDGINGFPNGSPGDSDFGVTNTVGILVASAVSPLSGTVIAGNTISDTHYGIWTKNVPPMSSSANTFHDVAVPLTQS
jgi:nitrous oxidase accessory protein NosD